MKESTDFDVKTDVRQFLTATACHQSWTPTGKATLSVSNIAVNFSSVLLFTRKLQHKFIEKITSRNRINQLI